MTFPRGVCGTISTYGVVGSECGTLAPLPPDPVAWAAQWQPDDDDVAMLERAGVYVRAGVADVQRR